MNDVLAKPLRSEALMASLVTAHAHASRRAASGQGEAGGVQVLEVQHHHCDPDQQGQADE
jgi:hypothetical protein